MDKAFGLLRRQDAGKEMLELLQDPFSGQVSSSPHPRTDPSRKDQTVPIRKRGPLGKTPTDPSQQLQQTSIWFALGSSLGFTAAIAILFSLLRPYNQNVYAPRLKHADAKHAPPAIGKKPWSWITPLWRTTEAEMVRHVGIDATVFLRFTGMCRDIFLILSLIGCAILVPVNVMFIDKATRPEQWLAQITPSNVFGRAIWSQVVVAYLSNFVCAGFLWWNYKKVMDLRMKYFTSPEYQNSLHARTLLVGRLMRTPCLD